MKIYTLERRMTVEAPIEEAFAVFEDPRNLARITPAWLGFRITSGPVRMAKGAEITYQIRWLGMPVSWRTIISEYEPPHFFEDTQAEGPYRLWRHRHTFEERGGSTLVSDRVDYALPFGILGRLAHAVTVRRQLDGIFDYRARALPGLIAGRS